MARRFHAQKVCPWYLETVELSSPADFFSSIPAASAVEALRPGSPLHALLPFSLMAVCRSGGAPQYLTMPPNHSVDLPRAVAARVAYLLHNIAHKLASQEQSKDINVNSLASSVQDGILRAAKAVFPSIPLQAPHSLFFDALVKVR